jgi:hypothetical protein
MMAVFCELLVPAYFAPVSLPAQAFTLHKSTGRTLGFNEGILPCLRSIYYSQTLAASGPISVSVTTWSTYT